MSFREETLCQAQWMVARRHSDWICGWNLGKEHWHLVGDFDGDDLDEIYIRRPRWAGVLKWASGRFRVLSPILIHNLGSPGSSRESCWPTIKSSGAGQQVAWKRKDTP